MLNEKTILKVRTQAKSDFASIVAAYRKVCKCRRISLKAYYEACLEYATVREGKPVWLIREAERFVDGTLRRRKAKPKGKAI